MASFSQQESTQPSPTLSDMPAEMLLRIFSQLDPRSDRQSLYNLCLSSKFLESFAKPILFRQFHLPESDTFDDAYKRDCVVRIIQFTRACVRRPGLADWVREIDLDNGTTPWEEVTTYLNDEDFESFGWPKQIAGPQYPHLIALLASRLPKLTDITMVVKALSSMPLERSETMGFDVLSQALSSIKFVRFMTYGATDGIINLADLSTIIALPTLEVLQLTHWDIFEAELDYPQIFAFAPASSNLCELYLLNCFVSAVQLQVFMNSFRHLQVFGFSVEEGLDWFDNHIKPGEIRLALQSQAKSLRTVVIYLGCRHYDDDLEEDEDEQGFSAINPDNYLTFGSFEEYTNLKMFRVELGRLGEIKNLPPQVERLVFDDDSIPGEFPSEQLLHLRDMLPSVISLLVYCSSDHVEEMSQRAATAGGMREQEDNGSHVMRFPGSTKFPAACHFGNYGFVLFFHKYEREDHEEVEFLVKVHKEKNSAQE